VLPKNGKAMSPARAQTKTARSKVEHTNHEGTVPLPIRCMLVLNNEKQFSMMIVGSRLIILYSKVGYLSCYVHPA